MRNMTAHSLQKPTSKKPSKITDAQVFGLVLGSVVEQLRRQREWTQEELAHTVGISQPTLSKIEAGKLQPDAFLYGKLAAAFGLSVHELDDDVNQAISATKRAAEAVADRKQSPDDVFSTVGALALVGLIGFAVAALLGGQRAGSKKKG
jgi:DNA-binding XRE family transcriptional regulator